MVHELYTLAKRYLNVCIYLISAFYALYEMDLD